MNQASVTRQQMTPIHIPSVRRRNVKIIIPEVKQKEKKEPVLISELINPILEISRLPDRNRLLAEYLNR